MRRSLAIGVAVVVALVAAYAIGRRSTRDGAQPTAVSSTTTTSALPDVPGAEPIAGGAANGTLNASGEAFGIDAPIVTLRTITVEGARLSVFGTLADGSSGHISASGRVKLTGGSLTLVASTLVRRDGVAFAGSVGPSVTTSGPVTVSGTDVTVDSNGSSKKAGGPVRIEASQAIELGSFADVDRMKWIDPPSVLTVRSENRGWVDWAGSATLRAGDATHRAGPGALSGRNLKLTVRRGGTMTGAAAIDQLYDSGRPVFKTTATVDLVRPRVSAPAGTRAEVVWAPRNLGRFDMAMTRIRPASEAAHWFHLGLATLPHTFGGKPVRALGGDTSGFIGGGSIASIIAPGDADRRDITVEVPSGTAPGTYEALVAFEGNFETYTARFEIDVT